MNLDFPGVLLTCTSEFMHLQSAKPLDMLTSAIVGGGFIRAQHIINRHVDKSYRNDDAAGDVRDFARSHGLSEPFVGLMTAVHLDKAKAATSRYGGVTVATIVTAGLGNATAAGLTIPTVSHIGTINMIILVDANLSPAAMVNTVITATEVKTQVLLAHGVRTPDGHAATGTSTDAVVVAGTGRGELLPYAGPLTVIGWLVGRCVRQCMEEALR